MSRCYYKEASGCLIVFDLHDRISYKKSEFWKNVLDERALLSGDRHVPCLLVANKVSWQDAVSDRTRSGDLFSFLV